jgi:hypothetical protein
MSNNFALEIESIISRLQPLRLELLEAEQHFLSNSIMYIMRINCAHDGAEE